MNLPNYKNLDIEHFQHLFDNKSESYKLFWFRAVVDSIMEDKLEVSYDELINHMIADAWYMVNEYKLNLGPKDTLELLVRHSQGTTGLRSAEKAEKIISALSSNSKDKKQLEYKQTLTYNVPYRLQAPLMPYLKGDGWNGSKQALAGRINSYDALIYSFSKIDGLNSVICINKDWADYIKANYYIISGWIEYNMIDYLQRRNPDVPGISNKLFPPQERNLTKVKKYWKGIIELSNVHEIYSDSLMDTSEISIDHFIPWSYVTHDELWNLSPTKKSINSSKSNGLPDWDIYFSKLCELEYSAYVLANSNDAVHALQEDCLKEHINNDEVKQRLYLSRDLSREQYTNILEGIIHPVYIGAENLGFEKWEQKWAH